MVWAPLELTPLSRDSPSPSGLVLDVSHYRGPIPQKNGTLLPRSPPRQGSLAPAAAKASRILYTSQNSHGKMAVSTGAIFLPKKPAPAGGYRIVAWAHGTVGLGDACTPSAGDRYLRDVKYLDHWLNQGYAVVATDYVGLGTPGLMAYLDGKTSAHNVVDSVIAAQRSALAKFSPKWVVVGQSQGGGVAMNTARYATEFGKGSGVDYRGGVSTGTPAHIEDVLQFAGPHFPPFDVGAGMTSYILYVLAGFRDARPDMKVNQVLNKEGLKWVKQSETLCYGSLHKALDDQKVSLSSLFAKPLLSIPGIHKALQEYMGTPASGYDRPIFVGQGLKDVDVPHPSPSAS
ncbi:MAG: lipase family protein [Lawsonella clevelandensis]